MRIKIRRLQACIGLAGLMVLGVPAAAQAQTVGEVLSPFFHTQTGTYEYEVTAGGPYVFALMASQLDDTGNTQAIVGSFDQAPFVGVVFTHDYDLRRDIGRYEFRGTVDPTGTAPALPVSGFLQANVDRTRAVTVVSVSGSIGSRAFSGSTPPIVNPFYSPFG